MTVGYSNQIQIVLSEVYLKKKNMKINFKKTRVISWCIETNWYSFDYVLCRSSITRTECIRHLGVLIDTKLHNT